MAELIDKSAVVARLRTIGAFEYNDTRRNAFKEILDMIEAQPSTTEAEIRAKAIDEFAELLKKAAIRGAFEYKPDKKAPWRKELVYCKVVGTRKIDEIAKRLKGE